MIDEGLKPVISFKLPINCIVINGDVYMPTKVDKLSCIGCDLKDRCKHLLMCPASFHNSKNFAHTIYKKLESNELVKIHQEEEQAEHEAPSQKKEIWHDVKLNTPESDGIIVLYDSVSKKFDVGEYYQENSNIYFFDLMDPYTWADSAETFVYDRWCYLEDLLKDGADLQ